jgi:hypothetical protein
LKAAELLCRRSELKLKSPSAVDQEADVYTIDYVPQDSESDEDTENSYFFSSLLTEQLQLWNLSVQGYLGEKRRHLKRDSLIEERLELISLTLQHSKFGKDAYSYSTGQAPH